MISTANLIFRCPTALRDMWALLLMFLAGGCGGSESRIVVVYCAQDQVYAEPILREFTRRTGIAAKPLFDSEAVKTTGLVNRMVAEKEHPVADVFWANEPLRVASLQALGLWADEVPPKAIGYRRRVWVVREGAAAVVVPPRVRDLASGFTGKISMAFPLFGSTTTHLAALRSRWGAADFARWCRELAGKKPFLEEGNSHVVRRVARGEADIGMTDSDDVRAGISQGMRVQALPMDEDGLDLENIVAVLKKAPHPDEARSLQEYLMAPSVAGQLSREGALVESGSSPRRDDWMKIAADFEATVRELEGAFRR